MVTIPEKLKEMTDSIVTKVTAIKDKIIEFALAPFNKIKELMQGLLVGVLESVEGLPFVGAKATAMKNKILGIDENETGTTSTEALDNASTSGGAGADKTGQFKIATNDEAKVIDPASGDVVKFGRFDEDGAAEYAAEISKLGQGKFEPYFETKGSNHYAIKKTGESITGTGSTTTGGATGGELNTESQMLAASGAGGGSGGVVVGGSTHVSNNSSVQHNAADENAGVADKTVGDNLYAD